MPVMRPPIPARSNPPELLGAAWITVVTVGLGRGVSVTVFPRAGTRTVTVTVGLGCGWRCDGVL
jgi:hypothetical protein